MIVSYKRFNYYDFSLAANENSCENVDKKIKDFLSSKEDLLVLLSPRKNDILEDIRVSRAKLLGMENAEPPSYARFMAVGLATIFLISVSGKNLLFALPVICFGFYYVAKSLSEDRIYYQQRLKCPSQRDVVSNHTSMYQTNVDLYNDIHAKNLAASLANKIVKAVLYVSSDKYSRLNILPKEILVLIANFAVKSLTNNLVIEASKIKYSLKTPNFNPNLAFLKRNLTNDYLAKLEEEMRSDFRNY